MNKIITPILSILFLFVFCSWVSPENNMSRYKIDISTYDRTTTYYVNNTPEIENLIPNEDIIAYKVYELSSNNEYIELFNINLSIELIDDGISDTHGKAFPWGYQVYFNHKTMEEISSYDNISAGISTVIGSLAGILGPQGIAVGALIGLFELDWAIAQKQDLGDGVTLSNVLYVTSVHWWNSGNAIREGGFR